MDSEREREEKKLIDLQNSRNGFIDAIFKFNNDEVGSREREKGSHLELIFNIQYMCICRFVFRIPFRGHKFHSPNIYSKVKTSKNTRVN